MRTVLITGCSDGTLGAGLAAAFQKQGTYRVFATARNTEKMKELSALGVETLQLDVLSEESIVACVEKVSSMTNGTLDILINNAGAGYNFPVIDVPLDGVRNIFELNVFSALRVSQLFFPLLRDSKCPTKMIVNNTSVAGSVIIPFLGPYAASKAALGAFTEAMRLEMQPFGIKVIDMKTGGVKSHFFDNVRLLPSYKLPENSPYKPGRDVVENFMRTGPTGELMDQEKWANKVVKDLSKREGKGAPYQIWRGLGATACWFASTFIPVGWLDAKVKKESGLDEVEKRIKWESQRVKEQMGEQQSEPASEPAPAPTSQPTQQPEAQPQQASQQEPQQQQQQQ